SLPTPPSSSPRHLPPAVILSGAQSAQSKDPNVCQSSTSAIGFQVEAPAFRPVNRPADYNGALALGFPMTNEMKKTISVQTLKGIVQKPLFPVSIEEMNRARTAAGAAAGLPSAMRKS